MTEKKNRVALLTSGSLRHRWVAARIAEVAELSCIISETKPPQNSGKSGSDGSEMKAYLDRRDLAEAHWFGPDAPHFSSLCKQHVPLPWHGVNESTTFDRLQRSGADIILLFGASIVRDPILSAFEGRIVNMHLGLSPYYRGSATNYWPLVDGLPECVGVTVHHTTSVLDGGSILAQARPEITPNDDVHDIGCKTIIAGASLLQTFAQWCGTLPEGKRQMQTGKLCRRADFDMDSLRKLEYQFRHGMLSEYLANKQARDADYPIVAAP